MTPNPDSSPPTFAGVPGCMFQNLFLSQCYCFKSCLVSRHGHSWTQMTVLEPGPLMIVQRSVLADGAGGSGGGRQHVDMPQPGFRKKDGYCLLAWHHAETLQAPCFSGVARNICLYQRKPIGCSCLVLTSTERHVLLLGIVAL